MGAPGCDDAPLVEIEVGAEAKPITMIYPYYDNPQFLQEQIARWRGWPLDLRRYVNLIVVDDCSRGTSASVIIAGELESGGFPFPVRCFRIKVDVRWNWLAARNIGAHKADVGWILLTDIDHVVLLETARALIHGKHDAECIYRFSRTEGYAGTPIHPHPNSWFMTREMFWRIGGYDERMSGYYGSDGYYRRRCAATAPIRIMTAPLERHEHEGDSSTLSYKRKQPEDAALRPLVRSFPPGSKPRTLSYPYVEEQLT